MKKTKGAVCISILKKRNLIKKILPSESFLISALNKRGHFYLGIDPTGERLHLGHLQNLLILRDFWEAGARVTILLGGFTAKIGDPTGKDTRRFLIDTATVEKNIKLIRPVIRMLFPVRDKTISIKDNTSWFNKMKLSDFMGITGEVTSSQLLERDMFKKRSAKGQAIHVNEMLYPLFQAYDSVALSADGELCGSDQLFNALLGRDLVKRTQKREKCVIATTLIEDEKTSTLMSKSMGTGVFIGYGKDAAKELFGSIMASSDGFMKKLFLGCTRIPVKEVNALLRSHKREAKITLAHTITSSLYGESKADMARSAFRVQFQEKGVPSHTKSVLAKQGEDLLSFLIRMKFFSSRSEAKRKVREGAVSLNEEKIYDPLYKIKKAKGMVLRVGKKILLIIR